MLKLAYYKFKLPVTETFELEKSLRIFDIGRRNGRRLVRLYYFCVEILHAALLKNMVVNGLTK